MCQGLSVKLICLPKRVASRTLWIASLTPIRAASLIIKIMIRTWKILKNTRKEIKFSDQSSLDAITRQLPEGYYSTFRTFDGCTRVLGLPTHLQRLPDIDASSLRRNLTQLLEPYRPDEVRVRVMKTIKGQVYVSIEPLNLLLREVYENGVHVETTEIRRESPRLKSTAFIGQSQDARSYIAKSKVFEALLIKKGIVLEGMTSNFFYVVNNVLFTAQRDILLGVTRRNVIRVARKMGVKVVYRPLNLDQISAVSEAFITSSSRGIVPVVQINDDVIGAGIPGEKTQMLMFAYENYVLGAAEKIEV